jgi:hypothetical protein
MYFSTKNYLKSTRNYIVKQALTILLTGPWIYWKNIRDCFLNYYFFRNILKEYIFLFL